MNDKINNKNFLSILLVTGNKYKLESTRKILSKYHIVLDSVDIKPPEIQADLPEEVAKFSARFAADKLNQPVIKADAGLFIDNFNGFPGIYTEYVRRKIGPEGILKLMENVENRTAEIVYALAYCEPNKEPIVFKSGSKGIIIKEKKGTEGMLIDFIFSPNGENGKTMGELREINPEIRKKYWGNAEEQFAKWFIKKKKK